jgi:hypothetical protein
VFHRLWQAKFDNGGSILSSSQFIFATATAASKKNKAHFKSGQNCFKKIGLLTTI